MSYLHKVLVATAAIGSANLAYAYFSKPQGPKITVIKNSSKETPDTRRFNKNPMDDKKKRYAYSVCLLRQEQKKVEFKVGHEFCKGKWLK